MNARPFLRGAGLALMLTAGLGTADVAPMPVAPARVSAPMMAPITAAVPRTPERELADALQRIGVGDLDGALAGLDALLVRQPNFRLAHLARGDALLARAGALANFGGAARGDSESLADLRSEATLRLDALRGPGGADVVPAALLRFAPHERHAIVVDTRRARIFVYRQTDGLPELVADFYASHGKLGADKLREGDKRTPIGVYRVAGWLSPAELTEFYGAGAFPLTYPNAWDRRAGRDGFGIWLHGAPRTTYARAPRASDGCVVLANDDLRALVTFVDGARTPVVIEDGVRMVAPATLRAERFALEQAIESWRADWQSRNPDRYLAHYARDFASEDGLDRAGWGEHKRRVNAAKRYIEVGVGELSLQRVGDDLAVATFAQDYRSDNLSGAMQKRQYWVREDGVWRIAWEGDATKDLGRPMRSRAQLQSLAVTGSGLPSATGAKTSPQR